MPEEKDPQQLPLDFTGTAVAPDLAPGAAALQRVLLRAYRAGLQSNSWRVRKKGANGLAALGPAAREAVPQLEQLLQDKDRRVRDAAALALSRIGD
jgi:HEAT repeat protein